MRMSSFFNNGSNNHQIYSHRNNPLDDSTQPMDSQFSPGGMMNDGNTVRFDDTVPLEHGYDDYDDSDDRDDTQVVNVGEETQLLDIPDYTETQLIDEFDTQVVFDSDNEGTDRTEVVYDTDELSEDDSVERDKAQSANGEKAGCDLPCKEGRKKDLKQPDTSSNEQRSTGSVQRNFASIRAASLRASGLAAHKNGKNSGAFSVPSNSCSSEEPTVKLLGTYSGTDTVKVGKEIDKEHVMGTCSENARESRSEDNSGVRSSIIRRLFSEDVETENGGFSNDRNNGDGGDLLQFLAAGDELAGLSYIDSQEPGELSQANALEFVDKFIQENADIDEEVALGKKVKESSKLVSTIRGPQSLAKSTNRKCTLKGTGAYDWDDNCEDESGGDIMRRKYGEFFGGEKVHKGSLTEPQRSRSRKSSKSGHQDGSLNFRNKIMRSVHSDSKLTVHNFRDPESARVAQIDFRKNLINDLNEECDGNSLKGQTETTVIDDAQTMNVGFDTQLAAEAMEALCNGESLAYAGTNDACASAQNVSQRCQNSLIRRTRNRVYSEPSSMQKRDSNNLAVATRRARKTEKTSAVLGDKSLKSLQKRGKIVKGGDYDCAGSSGGSSVKKQDVVGCSTPVAYRTRQSASVGHLQIAEHALNGRRTRRSQAQAFGSHSGKRNGGTELASESPTAGDGTSKRKHEKPGLALTSGRSSPHMDTLSHPRRTRSHRKRLCRVNESTDPDSTFKPSVGSDCNELAVANKKRMQDNARSTCAGSGSKRRRSASCTSPGMRSADKCLNLDVVLSLNKEDKLGEVEVACNSSENRELSRKANECQVSRKLGHKTADNLPSRLDQSPTVTARPLDSACTTPSNPVTPVNKASPVCMGDGYLKQSCRKSTRSCLLKELRDLADTRMEPNSSLKPSRKRRDIGNVRILYSHHLDEDIVKHQKKMLARLGVSVASSITDATHFITDNFVRTRNMLEAIASGKPVVTHLWIESCAQASCFIDEKNYILRDSKKEKELGFNMLLSLECARQRPLLQGRRVLITPNAKPGKEIISSLVKAVHGLPLERVGRSTLNVDRITDDLLILSCEEDYAMCVPFLEKGAAIYSSELVLNGIVIQKLEYERHRLFADHVKRTRSTTWLRKDGKKFERVDKNK